MFTLLIALSGPSNADVSPGPFYHEDCTVDQLEQAGTTCQECDNWVSAADSSGADPCETEFTGTAYEYVCQTYGASSWTEVWCDGPPKERRCGCATGGLGAGSWVAGLVLLGAMARRRGR